MIAGVCGGIASYLGIDSTLVRLAFAVLLFASGIGFPIYIILWIIIPREVDLDKPGAAVIQENIGDMGKTVTSGLDRFGRPATVGVVFILLGAYFLTNQLGWLEGLSGIIWPLVIIGAGVYMLARRS
jgi:phage shock protein C